MDPKEVGKSSAEQEIDDSGIEGEPPETASPEQPRSRPVKKQAGAGTKLGPAHYAVAVAVAVFLIAGCLWLVQRETVPPRPDLSVLPGQLERNIDIMSDIFQMARLEAMKVRDNDVIVATDVEFATFADLAPLKLPNAPSEASPDVNGFRYRFFPNKKTIADEQLETFYMAPMVAWPLLAESYPEKQFPVIMGHPADGYGLGMKSLRVRWMDFQGIQELNKGEDIQLDLEQWPFLERQKLKERLDAMNL